MRSARKPAWPHAVSTASTTRYGDRPSGAVLALRLNRPPCQKYSRETESDKSDGEARRRLALLLYVIPGSRPDELPQHVPPLIEVVPTKPDPVAGLSLEIIVHLQTTFLQLGLNLGGLR